MSKQTITAFYDSREYANNAVLLLRQAGIADGDVTLSPETAAVDAAGAGQPARGFWASLEELFGGTDDHPVYAEGLRRGVIMLTAHVDDAKVDDAVRILEQHGSVDLDELETAWRSEGWTGATRVTGGGIANEGAGPLRSVAPVEDAGLETTRAAVAAPAVPASAPIATATSAAGRRDDVIQVVEEKLSVGKRAVNRGKVRIHSYVVEKPVSETVSLRDETVTVARRPVDRPLAAAELGADAFRDRTIEMEEIDEEAVVAKTVRVVEEIGIRKDVTDTVKTITDTVRSTKVDIEDARTGDPAATMFTDTASVQRATGMEVVGSDGKHVGVVDRVDGTAIKLKRIDQASGGAQDRIPTEWVQSVDSKIRLKITAADAKSRWTAA